MWQAGSQASASRRILNSSPAVILITFLPARYIIIFLKVAGGRLIIARLIIEKPNIEHPTEFGNHSLEVL